MKQHKIIIITVIVLAVVLAGFGLYHYQTSSKGISLQVALAQRDTARAQKAVAEQKYANLKQVSDYNDSQVKATSAKLAAACTTLKAAKLTSPSCQ